jgi:hypothetical protein
MGRFKVIQLISKATSVISGSLIVNGTIQNNLFGTASYVDSSSYSINSLTASYTNITLIPTSSYSITVATSSISQTASYAIGPQYAPTVNIGNLSSNIYFGTPDAGLNQFNTAYGGIHFTPITITKNCSAVTMSCPIITAGAAVIRYAIYSNSTSSFLPQFLLSQCSASVGTINSTIVSAPLSTPLPLLANTTYWIAFAPATTVRFVGSATTQNYLSYNPLLHQRYTLVPTPAGITTPFLGNTTIRSGSTYGVTFPSTASQTLSQYSLLQEGLNVLLTYPAPVMPFLRVTY